AAAALFAACFFDFRRFFDFRLIFTACAVEVGGVVGDVTAGLVGLAGCAG
ncbi:MAG: hypothetical protein IMHGJWDQ_001708, partial [Candidatus Fervidibacter sp.]